MRNTCSEPECDKEAFGKGLCSADYQRRRYHGTLPVEPPERNCEHCGKPFNNRKWNARFCSQICTERARYAKRAVGAREGTCEHCGKATTFDRSTARFCSDKCGQDSRNATIAADTLTRKANRPPCKGCQGVVPPERYRTALYCTEECKIRARRHETYGLTKEDLAVLLAQHEQCAICATDDWGPRGPQVDHDHADGRVRGVLCVNCNTGLGRFGDDPARLRAAADYLEAHAS